MGERSELPKPLKELIGTVISGRYVVERCVGLGGMAVVFRGRHATLDRFVAIKVLRPELMDHGEVVARFDREARAASHFEHPNCIQVFDAGTAPNGLKFMVMPFLRGRQLARVLERPLPTSQAVALCCQILRGLEYAHRQGVVHRDLKPDNIFVVRDHEGRELLKVVDFGIAKLLSDAAADGIQTKVGAIVGTPAYMSPEQALGSEVDGRADLYAVGVILYQMIAGRLPFSAPNTRGLLYQHVAQEAPPLPATAPAPLRAVVERLLAKNPDRRFASAGDALAALDMIAKMLASDPTPWVELLSRSHDRAERAQPAAGRTVSVSPTAGSSDPDGPRRAEVEKMNAALQQILTAEEEMEEALRSGIFQAPPGGWNASDVELEPDPDPEPAAPTRLTAPRKDEDG